jgi:AraC-like DNA-binding protein
MVAKSTSRYLQMIAACTRALRCTRPQLEVLLEGTGIEPGQLAQPHGILPRDREILFYRNLLREFPEAGLGLRLGSSIKPHEMGPIGFAGLTSSDIVQSIEVARKYMDLVLPYLRWDLVIGKQEIIHRLSDRGEAPRDLHVFLVELVLALLKSHAQEHFGPHCLPTRVTLTYADPGYAGLYRRIFDAPVQFSQPSSELRFPKRYLEIALPHSDPPTHRAMEALCASMAARLDLQSDVIGDVIAILRAGGPEFPTQQDVADRLCISPRSLRRQLQEHQRSFRSLVDEVRMRKAKESLNDPDRSIRQVAEDCGFAELRGFYSAFQRWTGCSPAAWREQHVESQEPLDR